MKKLFEKFYEYPLFRVIFVFISLFLIVFSLYKVIIDDGYNFVSEPTNEFINEVKLKYIDDFNLLNVNEIKFNLNYNKSCRNLDVETDKLLFKYYTSDIVYAGEEKPRVKIHVEIKEPKISFNVEDLTDDLGVKPEINKYILDKKEQLQNICAEMKYSKEKQEQKREYVKKVEQQLSLINN